MFFLNIHLRTQAVRFWQHCRNFYSWKAIAFAQRPEMLKKAYVLQNNFPPKSFSGQVKIIFDHSAEMWLTKEQKFYAQMAKRLFDKSEIDEKI